MDPSPRLPSSLRRRPNAPLRSSPPCHSSQGDVLAPCPAQTPSPEPGCCRTQRQTVLPRVGVARPVEHREDCRFDVSWSSISVAKSPAEPPHAVGLTRRRRFTLNLIGSKPSPRVLVFGITADTALGLFIREVAPTVRYVESERELSLIRQVEWDAAIILNDPPSQPALAAHLMVLQFGGSNLMNYSKYNPPAWIQVIAKLGSVATEFIIPDSIPLAIHRLSATSLLPLLQSQSANMVVMHQNHHVGGTLSDKMDHSFAADADGQMLAGYIEDKTRQWWWLPANAPDKNTWITAAFSEWSKIWPEIFPAHAVWTERPQWQTMEERKAVEDLRNMREERDRALADFSQRERILTDQYERARSEADRTERRLLTAQGTDLVDEVKAALEEIGFKVWNADEEFAVKGDLLEDLRIEDPDTPGWISLAEVRGYAGGAKGERLSEDRKVRGTLCSHRRETAISALVYR
jgi:hypothetical protein